MASTYSSFWPAAQSFAIRSRGTYGSSNEVEQSFRTSCHIASSRRGERINGGDFRELSQPWRRRHESEVSRVLIGSPYPVLLSAPEFLLYALEQRVAEVNREMKEAEASTLSEYVKTELINLITLRDIAELDMTAPGFRSAVHNGSKKSSREQARRPNVWHRAHSSRRGFMSASSVLRHQT